MFSTKYFERMFPYGICGGHGGAGAGYSAGTSVYYVISNPHQFPNSIFHSVLQRRYVSVAVEIIVK
jgi:hypothetical protein